ncbi:hypothetical protein JZM24_00650 [Candidatus Sodalis endolongispinus]|uniref:Phage protein n=1 Tax=Candidatus Sodalis endolongispinus TaxID=2812662 RepID=A0ABS5YA95_9GAMM|nr:hypothetical protein [Candidatus Sodalis endolongispinus]MBT9431051.1 hypothetical protein [Candidatus Sodalis endolongispinus]
MNALRETYNITGATEERFALIASAAEHVVEEFGVLVNGREITPFMGGDYIVEVKTDTAKIIDMNFHIAELISKDARLDSPEMTTRFEHIRKHKTESEYIA